MYKKIGKNADDPESNKISPTVSQNDIIVCGEPPKADIHVVRPTFLEKQRSVSAKATHMIESMKEKTGEALEAIKEATGKGVATIESGADWEPFVVSVIEQKFSTQTKTVLEGITIEKKWVDGKKNVEVPVKYERIFVNNQELGKSFGETLTQIRDTILNIVPVANHKDYDNSNWIPLSGPDTEMEKKSPSTLSK